MPHDFRPTHYMRLISRHSRVSIGIIEYRVTDIGIEDPDCTIVPMMLLYESQANEAIVQFNDLLYEARIVRWGVKDHAVLHLPLNASPLG